MTTDSRLKILIDADGKPAVAGINDARQAVVDLGDAADASGAPLTALAGKLVALGAGTYAISELVGMVQGWIAASAEAARASTMLDTAIKALPGGTQAQADALKELASATQAQTGADGDALVQAQARLAQQRLSAEAIGMLTPLLVDASEAARQMGAEEADLAGVAKVVGKAYTDSASALRRYGIALSDAEVAQIDSLQGMDRVRAIAEVMSRQFGGLAQTLGQTYDGASRGAAQATGDLAEALGDLITKSPGAVDGLSGYTEAVRAATGFVSEHAGAIREVAGDAGLLALVAALGMAAQKGQAWIAGQREATAATREQAEAQRTAAAVEVAAAGRKELSARANQTLARAAVDAAKGEHALLSAQLLQDPELARNKEFMDRLAASRKVAETATKNLRAADLALTGSLTASSAAAEKAAAAAAPLAAGWKEIGTVGGALNALMATMIGYDVGKWMREAAADAEAWYNPLTLVRAGLEGLDAALQASSETYRQFREAEQEHADRLEKEADFLKRVSEQSGVTVTSLDQLKEALASGAIVQNTANGAWEKGVVALRSLAQGLGAVDTQYARAIQVLDGYNKSQDAAGRVADQQAAAAIARAKAAGDEAGALRLTADARAAAAQRAVEAAAPERALLALAEERLAKLAAQAPVDEAARAAREQQIGTLTEEVVARRQALDATQAGIATAQAEAQAARLATATYGDQSAQLDTLIAKRNALAQAVRQGEAASAAGQAAQAALQSAQAEAQAAQEKYSAAVAVGQGDLIALANAVAVAEDRVAQLESAVEAGAAADAAATQLRADYAQATQQVADAARDAAAGQERLQAAIQREATIATAQAGVQLAELARRRDLAAAHHDQSAAADYAMQIMRQEAQVAELGAAAKAKEAEALREKARLMQIAAEANGEYTAAEQAAVAQTQDAATMLDLEGKALVQAGLAKRDQISLAQELAEKEQQLAAAFSAAGADGVRSMEDVEQAIRAAADSGALDDLADGLVNAFEAGALAADEYQRGLDAVSQKQKQVAAELQAGFSAFQQFVSAANLADTFQFSTAGGGREKALTDWLHNLTRTGTAGATADDTFMRRRLEEVRRIWAQREAQSSGAGAAPASVGANVAAGPAGPTQTVRFELPGKPAVVGQFSPGGARDLLKGLESVASVSGHV